MGFTKQANNFCVSPYRDEWSRDNRSTRSGMSDNNPHDDVRNIAIHGLHGMVRIIGLLHGIVSDTMQERDPGLKHDARIVLEKWNACEKLTTWRDPCDKAREIKGRSEVLWCIYDAYQRTIIHYSGLCERNLWRLTIMAAALMLLAIALNYLSMYLDAWKFRLRLKTA